MDIFKFRSIVFEFLLFMSSTRNLMYCLGPGYRYEFLEKWFSKMVLLLSSTFMWIVLCWNIMKYILQNVDLRYDLQIMTIQQQH